ncbi:hypothetical protein ANCDUO_21546 [Ancylostoma duodenale]|uniref:Uncharacterized protein n=1 Tax=Ancylostoma duodenale TaxID=51022 RepID=A0A0C2CF11_9BILA|nr:hypothetical protein ANCDUO_21546 [Ancylostoma duodenale]
MPLSLRRPPVQGLVRKNTQNEAVRPRRQGGLVTSDFRSVGASLRSCGYGRDGATRKGVRTASFVFLTSRPPVCA